MVSVFIQDLLTLDPPFEKKQEASLPYLVEIYSRYQKEQTYSPAEYLKLLKRVGCSPTQIQGRRYFLPDFPSINGRSCGRTSAARDRSQLCSRSSGYKSLRWSFICSERGIIYLCKACGARRGNSCRYLIWSSALGCITDSRSSRICWKDHCRCPRLLWWALSIDAAL